MAHCLIFETSESGEVPPPPPRIFFGRDGLVKEILGLAEQLTPIALIGPGGIGKTSIALAVLHDNRIKERFGDDRRFIRCDQFNPSLPNFLRRLSKVIGAGIENPEDLASLRPFLSSREILIVLDNAEVILDQQGVGAQGIYSAIEELSRFTNICLCVTSRISTIPPNCETLEIPTLSMEAACDTFYRIYRHRERSDLTNNILEQLEFHPLSITLLATVGHQNRWGVDRLIKEWEKRRTGVLETRHKASLAATIKLSLTSPMFQELGPDAPGILGVVAFYPQGVDENNLDWLFPTTSNTAEIFDRFCVLSLTYRSDNFLTMLAPLRDYLSPKAPLSSPFLCITKDRYFARLSVILDTTRPEFGESRWITSEDVNVEHLLDVFGSIDANSDDVWDACIKFMSHLHWHKPRRVILGRRVEELPDDHLLKADCLLWLSALARLVGDHSACEQLFARTLRLWKAIGDPHGTAVRLRFQSSANSEMGLHAEAIKQAREALDICEKLGDTMERAQSLIYLALALASANQLDAAEKSASHAITLLPEDCDQFFLSYSHATLGGIYRSKGDNAKAIEHFEVALEITLAHDWHLAVSPVAADLVMALTQERRFEEANAHIKRAKPRVAQANSATGSARLMTAQAMVWSEQRKFEEAVSELSQVVDIYEKLGATADAEKWRTHLNVLKVIRDVSTDSFLNGEF